MKTELAMSCHGFKPQARGKASRLVFKKMQDQKLALYCCQRTIRNYYIGKTWLWWQLWLLIKPNLKCTKFAQYKAEYEEKIAIAEKNIDKAIAECKKVTAEHERLAAEKSELTLALQSGGSAVQDIIDKTTRIEGMKNDLQKQLDDTNNRIKAEEESIASIGNQGGKVKAEADKLRGDIKLLEAQMEACEEDKVTKDSPNPYSQRRNFSPGGAYCQTSKGKERSGRCPSKNRRGHSGHG